MTTIEIDGFTYQHCQTQADIDAIQSEDSDIYVDFNENEDAKIAVAGSVLVKACRNLIAYGAEIGGNIDATSAEIGGIYATEAEIGGGIYATEAKIGGITAFGAKISGVSVTAPTAEQIALLDRLREDLLPVLVMNQWHGPNWNPNSAPGMCGTTHCLAGGAQALSEDPEIRRMRPHEAGLKLLPCCAHLFFAPQKTVEKYLTEREYAK